MKHFSTRLFTLAAALLLCFALLPQRAEAASSGMSGSSSLRAGDQVTVTFSVSGSGILAIECNLSYDSSKLDLLGATNLLGGSWDVQQNGSKYLIRDTSVSKPISGTSSVLSFTFRVKSGVSAGSTVSAQMSNVVVSDGESDYSAGSASWSAKIQAPLSNNANLSSLTCSNVSLGFNGGTEYSVTVPYEVTSLDLDWSVAHSGARASVSGNSLSVGSNTVTITVTAENGATKRYYIYVTRQEDPNYVPSSDATLSGLTPSTGTLSPAFREDVLDYVVYVPYEVESIQLSGTAKDAKAKSVQQLGAATLQEGTNEVILRCTAEDGTTKDYKVQVIRMPAYAGVLPEIISPDAEPVEPEPQEPEEASFTIPMAVSLPYVGDVPIYYLAGAALFVLLALIWFLAWAIGRQGGRRQAVRQMAALSAPAEKEPLLDRLAAAESADQLTETKQDSLPQAPEKAESDPEVLSVPSDSPAPEAAPEAETPAAEDGTPAEEETAPETAENPAAADENSQEISPDSQAEAPADTQDTPEGKDASEVKDTPEAKDASEVKDTPETKDVSEAKDTPEAKDASNADAAAPAESAEETEEDRIAQTMSLDQLLDDIRNM